MTLADVGRRRSSIASQQTLQTIVGLPHIEDAAETAGLDNPAYSCNTWPPMADQPDSIAEQPDSAEDQPGSIAAQPNSIDDRSVSVTGQLDSAAAVQCTSVDSDNSSTDTDTYHSFTD